jgi:hypothetical protein
MTYRVISNKRIDLSDDEWHLYQNICKSYDRPNFKGSDLFSELFETDDKGIIIFLKPPTKFTSMEVFLFMMSIMQHQHLRVLYNRIDQAVADCKEVTGQAKEVTGQTKELIKELEKCRVASE